jgi:hypothetical protein
MFTSTCTEVKFWIFKPDFGINEQIPNKKFEFEGE